MTNLQKWLQQEILDEYSMQNTINTETDAFKAQEGSEYSCWKNHEQRIVYFEMCARLEAQSENTVSIDKRTDELQQEIDELLAEDNI